MKENSSDSRIQSSILILASAVFFHGGGGQLSDEAGSILWFLGSCVGLWGFAIVFVPALMRDGK